MAHRHTPTPRPQPLDRNMLFAEMLEPASYVDRILHGAKPSELPVQTPTKCDLRAVFFVLQGAAKRMRHRTPIAGSELRGKLIQTASIAASAVTLEHCPGRSNMREQL
jgi:hypothetical protein